jgi:hypothetical protein
MAAAPENSTATRTEWLLALLITFVVVGLHLHFWQQAGGLWRDEVNLVNLAASPTLADMMRDSFPILMPLLVKGWSQFGTSDMWLRTLGMFFGLTIPSAFWLVAKMTRRPPLFSQVFFGLNALLICYGDSLRAYGFGSALIVAALAALLFLLRQPSWPRAALLALVATLCVQVLYQNSVLFLAICGGGFAVCWRRKDLATALKIFTAGNVAAISLLPYYQTFQALPQTAIGLRRGFSPFITSLNFDMATGFPFEQVSTVWKILVLVVIFLAFLTLRRKAVVSSEVTNELTWFAGITVLAVVICFLTFLWFAAVTARPWYFLPPLALLAVCFDLGIAVDGLPRLLRTATFGLLAGLALVAGFNGHADLRTRFTNVDRLAARVAAEAQPEDFIVVTPWFCGITFNHYFHGATPWSTLPPLPDHTIHRYDLVLEAMKDTNSLTPVLEKISVTLKSGHRVWVVGLLEMPADPNVMPPVLPPPPLPVHGWSDTPYMGSWAARVTYLLQHHGARFGSMPDENVGQLYLQENLHLFMAQGWRE